MTSHSAASLDRIGARWMAGPAARASQFAAVLQFELSALLRQPGTWVMLATMVAVGVALASARAHMPGGLSLTFNAAHAIAQAIASQTLFAGVVTALLFSDAALRDRASGMDEIVDAAPVPGWLLTLARYLSAAAVTILAFVLGQVGYEATGLAPWIDPAVVGPTPWQAHGLSLVLLIIPTTLILGALFMAVATYSRSLLAVLLTWVAVIAQAMAAAAVRLEDWFGTYAPLIDPSAMRALVADSKYWTFEERQSQALLLDGMVAGNRAVWLAIAAGLLASVVLRPAVLRHLPTLAWPLGRQPALPTPGRSLSRAGVALPSLAPHRDTGHIVQFLTRLRFEISRMLWSWSFLALLVVMGGVLSLLLLLPATGTVPVLPVSASVVPVIATACALPGLLAVILFTGDAVWRERRAGIADIIDATPTAALTILLAKLASIALVIFCFATLAMVAGVWWQLYKGSPSIELSHYAYLLYVFMGGSLLQTAGLALLAQAVAGGRLMGYLLTLVLFGCLIGAELMGWDQPLLQFSDLPDPLLSDMNGLGDAVPYTLWLLLYWSFVTVVLVVAAHLMWPRGPAATWRQRLAAAWAAFHGWPKWAAIGASAAALALGGAIHWNTRVLNPYFSASQAEATLVEYETMNRPHLGQALPEVAEIDVAVDLDPEQLTYRSRGRYRLINPTKEPISEVQVGFDDTLDVQQLALAGAEVVRKRACCQDYQLKLTRPLQPGEARDLTFALEYAPKGWISAPRSHAIRSNGTFLSERDLAPAIGISPHDFLQDDKTRSRNGLKPLADLPDPGRLKRNYILPTGFSRFAITVSTAPDQTAVAPGTLVKEWQENGRRYFRYETPEPILNFWSLQSARYTTVKDRWKGVDLAVYHHPQHGAQVPRMLDAMKRALEYCTVQFGPYQHTNLRIVEFPYGNFAQSFANTVPYAEMIGFIADPVELANFDVVTLVTAHETAHQWFAHQIISSDVPGATFLSETLAEYAALKVMEQQFGRERIGYFLKYELDRYFADRGVDGAAAELPLAEVTPQLPHVAYQKGGHAMYALSQVIGDAAVNKVLHDFVQKYRFKSDPYPAAADLVTALRGAAGAEHQGLITDLFERIVTWDFQIEEAVSRPAANSQWETTVTFTAEKWGQNNDGRGGPLPLDEPVELMLSEFSPSSYTLLPAHILKRQSFRVKNDRMTVTIMTPTKPAFVTVNPDLILLQRAPSVAEVE